MNVPENRDANDELAQFGSAAIREALESSKSMLPPIPPYEEERANKVKIAATPFIWRDPADIPPRQWVYGRHLIRKFLSLDIAAGGIGKSSVKVVEALAMTSGRELLGKTVHGGPLRVWLYNLEDPDEETERRIHAACIRYEIGKADIAGRLFVDSGRDQPLCIAEETDTGARIIRPVVDALIETLTERKIDAMVIDPFVSSHFVSENDNRAIDMVAKEWARIADQCNCAINLVHHVRKANGNEVTAESSRGAVSLIGAARSVIVYNRMTKEEGERAGIEPDKRGFYFRTQNDKANLAPPEAADWHRMNNVDLPNGDQVGVACPWEWPDPFDGVQTWHLKRTQKLVSEGEWREDVRASNWVGIPVAQACDLDPKKDRGKLRDIIKQWLQTDVLRLVEKQTGARQSKWFVEVGTWFEDGQN